MVGGTSTSKQTHTRTRRNSLPTNRSVANITEVVQKLFDTFKPHLSIPSTHTGTHIQTHTHTTHTEHTYTHTHTHTHIHTLTKKKAVKKKRKNLSVSVGQSHTQLSDRQLATLIQYVHQLLLLIPKVSTPKTHTCTHTRTRPHMHVFALFNGVCVRGLASVYSALTKAITAYCLVCCVCYVCVCICMYVCMYVCVCVCVCVYVCVPICLYSFSFT